MDLKPFSVYHLNFILKNEDLYMYVLFYPRIKKNKLLLTSFTSIFTMNINLLDF